MPDHETFSNIHELLPPDYQKPSAILLGIYAHSFKPIELAGLFGTAFIKHIFLIKFP